MFSKERIIVVVLLIVLIALVAGCTGSNTNNSGNANATVKYGDNVTADYTLYLANGSIIDTSIESVAQQAGLNLTDREFAPITFVIGDGNYISGFENGTIGMKVGETRNITLTPDEAYGEYNQSLIMPVNMSDMTNASIVPYVNESLYDYMLGYNVRIASIPNNSTVMVDYNPPLAGQTLTFRITLLSINSAA
jgi:FKBP-type peptidyl-prolyl cis-trans isomerase 2